MVHYKMFLSMAGLTRTKTGGYRGRKGIPKDLRMAYQKVFGPGSEAKLFLPAKMPLPEAKAKFAEWLVEIETPRSKAFVHSSVGKPKGSVKNRPERWPANDTSGSSRSIMMVPATRKDGAERSKN
jgi:hypothetical protein